MKELRLDNVSVRFGKIQALSDVSLRIESGAVYLLAGPNGAGKSTLIRVLLGLVRPSQGQLVLDGVPRRIDHDFKEHLGYLPEAVAFSENLTGRQVMRFFAAARGVSRRHADEVLKRVGLSDAARRAVRGYSRGMRQRLGLGVAILGEPEVLVLDEPTVGLDQEGLTVLWDVMDGWRRTGRIVLMASHDLALLERRVDRVCLLRSGSVLANDTPVRLREQAHLPVMVNFSTGPNGAAQTWHREVELWGHCESVRSEPGLVRVAVEAEHLLALLDLSARTPNFVERIRVEEPGLDAIYDSLLRGEAP